MKMTKRTNTIKPLTIPPARIPVWKRRDNAEDGGTEEADAIEVDIVVDVLGLVGALGRGRFVKIEEFGPSMDHECQDSEYKIPSMVLSNIPSAFAFARAELKQSSKAWNFVKPRTGDLIQCSQ